MPGVVSLVRSGVAFARGRGVVAAVRKAVGMYVAGRQSWYVIAEDLAHPVEAGADAAALDVRLATAGDLDWLASLGHHDRSTFNRWLEADHFLFVAFTGGQPLGFRCVSTKPAPWLAGYFRLRPDQLYGIDIFTAPARRRAGLARAIFARTSPLLYARGFRELVGVQRLDNADSIAALARCGFVRTGCLTRHRFLWRVWFSFAPADEAPARASRHGEPALAGR